ncbi:Propionate 3-nitronate monooxygenase OS=Streptomyces violarus OX=67380 GN=FHS41_003521 PE=3 SV=1 [Streptomyces violarus]
MPQPEYADPAAIDVYAHQLAGEASWYEAELGDPDSGRDDGYETKLNRRDGYHLVRPVPRLPARRGQVTCARGERQVIRSLSPGRRPCIG